mgnify:CR=1 FL=1
MSQAGLSVQPALVNGLLQHVGFAKEGHEVDAGGLLDLVIVFAILREESGRAKQREDSCHEEETQRMKELFHWPRG